MSNQPMADKTIYTVEQSEIVSLMEELEIPVNEETIVRAVDTAQDFLNQALRSDLKFYIDFERDQILGKEE